MKYNFCKNCGSPIQPGMANCQRCGAPAEVVQAVDENKPMAQPPGMLGHYVNNNPNQPMGQQPMNNGMQQQPMNQPMGQPMNNGMPQQMPQQPMGQPMMNQPMGQPMNNGMQQPMMNGQPMPQQQVQNGDDGSFLWAVVGFLFTLIGLILYFVWKDTKPNNAKMAGMGALVGFIASVILYATGIVRLGL